MCSCNFFWLWFFHVHHKSSSWAGTKALMVIYLNGGRDDGGDVFYTYTETLLVILLVLISRIVVCLFAHGVQFSSGASCFTVLLLCAALHRFCFRKFVLKLKRDLFVKRSPNSNGKLGLRWLIPGENLKTGGKCWHFTLWKVSRVFCFLHQNSWGKNRCIFPWSQHFVQNLWTKGGSLDRVMFVFVSLLSPDCGCENRLISSIFSTLSRMIKFISYCYWRFPASLNRSMWILMFYFCVVSLSTCCCYGTESQTPLLMKT